MRQTANAPIGLVQPPTTNGLNAGQRIKRRTRAARSSQGFGFMSCQCPRSQLCAASPTAAVPSAVDHPWPPIADQQSTRRVRQDKR
jgi:hypothetical protein